MLSIPTANEIVSEHYSHKTKFSGAHAERLTENMARASKRLIRERWFNLMDEETRVRALKTLKQLDNRFPE